MVGDSRLWQLGGGRVTAPLATPGLSLTDVAAVAPRAVACGSSTGACSTSTVSAARAWSCPLDGRNGTPLRLARLGRALYVSAGSALHRFEMTRRAPGICARQALRIVRARVLGGGRLRVTVTRRARLRSHRAAGGAAATCCPSAVCARTRCAAARTPSACAASRRGRYRLQLTAGAHGAQAGYAAALLPPLTRS